MRGQVSRTTGVVDVIRVPRQFVGCKAQRPVEASGRPQPRGLAMARENPGPSFWQTTEAAAESVSAGAFRPMRWEAWQGRALIRSRHATAIYFYRELGANPVPGVP